MGMPISSVGGASSAPIQTAAPAKHPTQVGGSSDTPSPAPATELWPPAYGFRLGAVQGSHTIGHNDWQSSWIEGGGMQVAAGARTVADMKVAIDPLLVQPNGKPHKAHKL